jgi:hypothetical protein
MLQLQTTEPTFYIQSCLSSSLIANCTEAEQVIDDYWNWKSFVTTNTNRRTGLAVACKLIER